MKNNLPLPPNLCPWVVSQRRVIPAEMEKNNGVAMERKKLLDEIEFPWKNRAAPTKRKKDAVAHASKSKSNSTMPSEKLKRSVSTNTIAGSTSGETKKLSPEFTREIPHRKPVLKNKESCKHTRETKRPQSTPVVEIRYV